LGRIFPPTAPASARARASFSTGWRRFAAAHGFGAISFHTLRHGNATLLLAGGVSDAVAIKLMGHADTKILRRYQEVVDEFQRDAAMRMDHLLGGRLSPEVSPGDGSDAPRSL